MAQHADPRRFFTMAVLAGCVAAWCTSAAAPAAAPSATPPQASSMVPSPYRDPKGVPHVFAADSAAVMYGSGYAFAQDRLAQMELGLRGALGTRAEILGASALEGDKAARGRLLSAKELNRMYATLPLEHRLMMQAFVDGIDRHVDEVERDPEHLLPYQFKQWGIEPHRWTLLDYLAYIASYPRDRGGYERQNQAFLDAMTAEARREGGPADL